MNHVLTPRARAPLAAAAGCSLAAALVWLAAYHVKAFETLDQRTLIGFVGLSGPHTAALAEKLARFSDPLPFAMLATALILATLVRRQPRAAIAIGAILVGANVTTQFLKPALGSSSGWFEVASWPSGHATAAMSLALCLLLAVPPRWRAPAAALGGLFAVGVGYSILILGRHQPSDVLGGFLIAGAWTGLALAGLHTAAAAQEDEPPLPTRTTLAAVGIAATALAAAVGIVALNHAGYAADHTTFMAGAAVMAVGALAISTATALELTRSPRP